MREFDGSQFEIARHSQPDIILTGIAGAMSECAEMFTALIDLNGVWLVLNGQIEADVLLERELPLSLLSSPCSSDHRVSNNLLLAHSRIVMEENVSVATKKIDLEFISCRNAVDEHSSTRSKMSTLESLFMGQIVVSTTPNGHPST